MAKLKIVITIESGAGKHKYLATLSGRPTVMMRGSTQDKAVSALKGAHPAIFQGEEDNIEVVPLPEKLI